MPVSKISGLELVQTLESVVPLTVSSLLILPSAIRHSEDRKEEYNDLTRKVDIVTDRVTGCLI